MAASASTKRPGNAWTAISAIAGIAGAAIALHGTSVANHRWIFKPSTTLTINPPSNGSIPRSATITGSMSLPTGYSVWVAQQGSGEANYYNLTKAAPVSGGWSVTMTVGTAADKGRPFTIYAFAVNDQTSGFISNILTNPLKSFFCLRSLPRRHLLSPRTWSETKPILLPADATLIFFTLDHLGCCHDRSRSSLAAKGRRQMLGPVGTSA
jgi:hypothetical protein